MNVVNKIRCGVPREFHRGAYLLYAGQQFLLLKQKEYKRRIDMSAARRKRKPVEAEEKRKECRRRDIRRTTERD